MGDFRKHLCYFVAFQTAITQLLLLIFSINIDAGFIKQISAFLNHIAAIANIFERENILFETLNILFRKATFFPKLHHRFMLVLRTNKYKPAFLLSHVFVFLLRDILQNISHAAAVLATFNHQIKFSINSNYCSNYMLPRTQELNFDKMLFDCL